MKRAHKIQEWLADRVSFVQYPNTRAADASTRAASRSGAKFEHAMPLGQRLDLVIFSGGLLIGGLVALAAVCGFFYLLITSAWST